LIKTPPLRAYRVEGTKFVVDEIARWTGPIKTNGLQVD
jgi:hypothetical protein